jgi:putative membrane protein
MMGGMEWGWGWMFSGGLMMLLFGGLLIVLVLLLLRGLTGGATTTTNADTPRREERVTPLEILQTRYARGEISRQEYDQMKTTLET